MATRNRFVVALGVCLVMAVLFACQAFATDAFLQISGNQFTYKGNVVKLKGLAYYPKDHPWMGMYTYWDYAEMQTEIPMLRAAGANIVKILVPYKNWDLDEIEWLVNLIGQNGMKVDLVLFDWEVTYPSAGTQTEAEHFAYVDAFARRFKNNKTVAFWDVKNEPEAQRDWNDPNWRNWITDWYIRMRNRIKMTDTNHPVSMGMWQADNVYDVAPYCDFLMFHSYTWDIVDEINTVKAVDNSKPIFVEEFGWPTNPCPCDQYNDGNLRYDFTETYQKNNISTYLSAISSSGIAGGLAWIAFDFDNYPNNSDPNSKYLDENNWYGLYKYDYTLKPAGVYFRDHYPVTYFEYDPPGTISGTVKDVNGNPLSGVTVETDPGGYVTTTNANGSYTLSGIAPGSYFVKASKSGYDSGTNPNVVVTSNQTTTSNINLVAAGLGAIYENDNGSMVYTGNWTRASDANCSGGSYDYSSTSGNKVEFTFTGTWVQWQTVTFSNRGYAAIYIDGVLKENVDCYSSSVKYGIRKTYAGLSDTSHTVRVQVTGTKNSQSSGYVVLHDRFKVPVPPSMLGTISGTVRDNYNNPLSGATVTASAGLYSATTDANGNYSLTGIAQGTYDVTASKFGYAPQTQTGVVVIGQQTTICDFMLAISTDWTEPFALSTSSGVYYHPCVTARGNHVYAAWSDNASGYYRIKFREFDGTSWGSIETVSSTTNNDYRPRLAVDSLGNVHCVWFRSVSGGYNVCYAKRTGTGWSSVTTLNPDPANKAEVPDIACDSNDCLHVVWENLGDSSLYIRYRYYNGSNWQPGLGSAAEAISNATNAYYPRIAVDSLNQPHVVFEKYSSGQYDVYYTKKSGGSWQTNPTNISSNSYTNTEIPRIAIDSQDRIHVVWQDIDNGTPKGIFYRVKSGGTWSPATSDLGYSVSGNTNSYWSTVAVDADGDPHIFWETKDSNNQYDIWYRCQDGGTWKPKANIVSNTGNNTETASAAFDANGNLHLVYYDNPGGAKGIYYKMLPASVPSVGTLSGWVKDSGNNPIVGATVTAGSYSATTDAGGNYSIANIPAGSYSVTVEKTGYVTQTQSGVNVAANQTATCNFTMVACGSITGWVKDNQSVPISGAVVTTNVGGYSTTTDASGNYTISNVNPATYSVTASKSGWTNTTNSNVIVSSGQVAVCNITMQRGTISGWVKDQSNNPLSGALVVTNTGGYSATTDGNGNYTIPNVLPGTYDVTASKNGYQPITAAAQIVTGAQTTTVNFNLPLPTGTISGSVLDNLGGPISGVTVQTNTGGYTATTDSNGNYTLSNVTPGTYNVTASKSGWTSVTNTGVVAVGAQVTTCNFTFQLGTIAGKVTEPGGEPCYNHTITTDVGGYSTVTWDDGSYVISNVQPGTYVLTAHRAKWIDKVTNSITVTGGQTTIKNITQSPDDAYWHIINGPRVKTAQSGSVKIWFKTLESCDGKVEWGTTPGVYTNSLTDTNKDGHTFTLTGLTSGVTYYYRVTASGTGRGQMKPGERSFVIPTGGGAFAQGSWDDYYSHGDLLPWISCGANPMQLNVQEGPRWGSGGGINARTGYYLLGYKTNNEVKNDCVFQRVSATAGQSYTLRAYIYTHQDSGSNIAQCRIGIDPTGGTDRTSGNVQWTSWTSSQDTWTQLTKTVTASSSTITLFLDAQQTSATTKNLNCFEDVTLTSP